MGTVDMKLKKSTMAIVGLLVLGAIAIAAVAMGDGKTARKVARQVGRNGHGYAPGPSIVAAEEAKIDPAVPGHQDPRPPVSGPGQWGPDGQWYPTVAKKPKPGEGSGFWGPDGGWYPTHEMI